MLKLLSDELWNGCRMFLVAALSNRVLKLKKLRDVMYALKCYIGLMYIHIYIYVFICIYIFIYIHIYSYIFIYILPSSNHHNDFVATDTLGHKMYGTNC